MTDKKKPRKLKTKEKDVSTLIPKWIENLKDLKCEEGEIGLGVHCLKCDVMFYPLTKGHVTQHLSKKHHIKCETDCGGPSKSSSTVDHFDKPVIKVEDSEEITVVQDNLVDENEPSKFSTINTANFVKDLAKALFSVNIPLSVVNNIYMKQFFEKYANIRLPSESIVRKAYVDKLYNSTIKEIQEDVGDNYIWTSIDLTTDANFCCYGNFILGILNNNNTKANMLTSKQLPDLTSETIVGFVQESLKFLWQDSYNDNRDKVLMIITDSSKEMIKAGELLKEFYPNLLHTTCLATILNKIAEPLYYAYPNVRKLISSVSYIFLEKPYRVSELKEKFTNLDIPSEPEPTRYGSWLDAVTYYANNFEDIKTCICSLNPEDSVYVAAAIEALTKKEIKENLYYVKRNFSSLGLAIRQLDSNCLSLSDSMHLLDRVKNDLNKVTCDVGVGMQEDLNQALQDNPDFCILEDVNKFLKNKREFSMLNYKNAEYFRYCPVAIGNINKCFSLYNEIFCKKKYCDLNEDLENLVVAYFNKDINL